MATQTPTKGYVIVRVHASMDTRAVAATKTRQYEDFEREFFTDKGKAESRASALVTEHKGRYAYEVWECTPVVRLEMPKPQVDRIPICN